MWVKATRIVVTLMVGRRLCCFVVPLMYSFLILSILVTPNENRNIFNSATPISASCLFVSATVSSPYNIAGLIATLYIFPFTLAGIRLSQITPDILLQPFHPACTLYWLKQPISGQPITFVVETSMRLDRGNLYIG